MSKPAWRYAAVAVQLVLVAVVLTFVVKTAADVWPDMVALDWEASPGLLAAAALAGLLVQVLLIIGWKLALRLVGADLSWAGATTSQLVGQLAKYVPGKLFTLLGKSYLACRAGATESQSAVAVFVECAMLLATSVAVGSAYIIAVAPDERRLLPAAAAAVVLSVGMLHPAILPREVGFVLRLLGRQPVPLRYDLRAVAPLFVTYLLMWAVTGAGIWLLIQGLGLHVPLVTLTAASAISWAAGFLSLIFPAGLGVREVALAKLLGASAGTGAAWSIALVSRGWMLSCELTAAALAWGSGLARRARLRNACPPEAETDEVDRAASEPR